MTLDLRYRFVAASLLAALAAAPVAAEGNPAKLMEDRLPKLCAELQTQGWDVPADQLKMDPKTKAEMRMGKRIYMCNLERPLAGKGPGRAPDLGALLTNTSRGANLILSVSVWCAADREPALAALAKEVERVLTGSKMPVPPGLLEAIRTPRQYEAAAEGLRYRAEPIDVDPGACDRVARGELGPVLLKMDVLVGPGA